MNRVSSKIAVGIAACVSVLALSSCGASTTEKDSAGVSDADATAATQAKAAKAETDAAVAAAVKKAKKDAAQEAAADAKQAAAEAKLAKAASLLTWSTKAQPAMVDLAEDFTATGTAASSGDIPGVLTAADEVLADAAKMRGMQPPASYPALKDCWNHMVDSTTRAVNSTKEGVSQMDAAVINRATGELNIATDAITSCTGTITRISNEL